MKNNLLKIGSKLETKNPLLNNNSSFLNQNHRSYNKPGQSRNLQNGLMNAKSVGANIENFSFIRPSSMKADPSFDKIARKQHKNKKSKGIIVN